MQSRSVTWSIEKLLCYNLLKLLKTKNMKIINKKGMIPNMESYLFIICGRWDLNPHDVTTTRSLVLLVCQFRHFRVSGVSRFCISHRRILIYHSSFCLASTFLNFFYFFVNKLLKKTFLCDINNMCLNTYYKRRYYE